MDNLLFKLVDGVTPGKGRVYLFTSTQRREGVTFTCLKVARELARQHAYASVAVVDMNPVHADLSDRVGAPAAGWRVVRPQGEPVALVREALRPLEGVPVLPFGGKMPDVAEAGSLFHFTDEAGHIQKDSVREPAQRLKALLETLRANYSLVLIDGPSVLATADTLFLAPLVDGVVFVVEAGKTRRQVVSLAQERLQHAGAKTLGVVLNRRRFYIPRWIYRRIFA